MAKIDEIGSKLKNFMSGDPLSKAYNEGLLGKPSAKGTAPKKDETKATDAKRLEPNDWQTMRTAIYKFIRFDADGEPYFGNEAAVKKVFDELRKK